MWRHGWNAVLESSNLEAKNRLCEYSYSGIGDQKFIHEIKKSEIKLIEEVSKDNSDSQKVIQD